MTLSNRSALAYTVAEAAQQLAISVRTMRRVIASGKVPVVRIGRCVRVPLDSLLALVSCVEEFTDAKNPTRSDCDSAMNDGGAN